MSLDITDTGRNLHPHPIGWSRIDCFWNGRHGRVSTLDASPFVLRKRRRNGTNLRLPLLTIGITSLLRLQR